jgi:muramoyltetrapeptide carboxypeptidase
MEILRPKALRAGDTVAVVALSGGLEDGEAELFKNGLEVIRELGFEPRASPLAEVGRAWWWGVATPAETAEELNRNLRDPDVRAIFGLTGGRLAMSYLDLIDLDAIRADPKPILGFSDVGTVLLALHARTGLVTIHGDMVTHGMGDWHDQPEARRRELEDVYRRVLTGAEGPTPLPPGSTWECWRSGRAEGRLLGGLLNRLIMIQATPFAFAPERFDGAILFLEELMTSFAAVWNNLHVLRYTGVFDRIAGLVVGSAWEVAPTPGGPETLRELVLDVLGDRDIPVLGNVDVGHNPPNIPMPLGVRAEVDADARTITLLEPAVEG